MTYSVDYRKKVVDFVHRGGSQAEAARRFEISLWCVRDWLSRKDLKPRQKGIPRDRKIDREKLRIHVKEHPDAFLRERAEVFQVRISSIEYALSQMKITHKKRRSSIKKETQKSA